MFLQYLFPGLSENEVTSTYTDGKQTKEYFYNEPHADVLNFENECTLGIGNLYLENDFIPKLPMGDDIWVIFGVKNLRACIDNLSLETLYDDQ
jgi:hypothetical protein